MGFMERFVYRGHVEIETRVLRGTDNERQASAAHAHWSRKVWKGALRYRLDDVSRKRSYQLIGGDVQTRMKRIAEKTMGSEMRAESC